MSFTTELESESERKGKIGRSAGGRHMLRNECREEMEEWLRMGKQGNKVFRRLAKCGGFSGVD